jgi:hypothetical protein
MQNDPELQFASDQPSANTSVQLQEKNDLIGERRHYVVKQVKVRVTWEIPLLRGNAEQLQDIEAVLRAVCLGPVISPTKQVNAFVLNAC